MCIEWEFIDVKVFYKIPRFTYLNFPHLNFCTVTKLLEICLNGKDLQT